MAVGFLDTLDGAGVLDVFDGVPHLAEQRRGPSDLLVQQRPVGLWPANEKAALLINVFSVANIIDHHHSAFQFKKHAVVAGPEAVFCF